MLKEQLTALTQQLAKHLLNINERLAVAESCTGGLISSACTDLPGSSQWFECAYICYSNQAKMNMLGVNEQTLTEHGAVSEYTVLEMVKACQSQSSVFASIAVSGIAGPDGGSAEKPVGTVCIAWAIGTKSYSITKHYDAPKNRQQIRYLTAIDALSGVLKYSSMK